MKKGNVDYQTLAIFIILVIVLVILGKFIGWW